MYDDILHRYWSNLWGMSDNGKGCHNGQLIYYQNVMGKLQITSSNHSTTVAIILHRKIGYHILTTFFPTICLLVLACLTLFIDAKHFEATIMVSLTTMLVMHTLHQGISADLPKTADIKMVDIWLTFGLIVPFLVFLTLLAVELLPPAPPPRPNSRARKRATWNEPLLTKEGVQTWSQVLIPGLTLTFMLGYGIVAAGFYFEEPQPLDRNHAW